jgi:hypothetical protein
MKFRIEVKQLANDQIEDAFLWYETQRKGLGYEFLSEWESFIGHLSENAENYHKGGLIIYNVTHSARHPSKIFRKK